MGDWRVKYDGVCSGCGAALHAGEVAVYDRPTHTIHCVACPTAPAPEPPEIDAGVAGRSARQEHERRAAKREAAVRERWGARIGGVVLATDEPQSTRAWAVGARGEEKLAKALDGFSVLHDRRVPGTKGNIDVCVPSHQRFPKLRSRPEAGSACMTVDHDDGVLEGTTAASGRRSIVATQASKNALASRRSAERMKT